MNYGVYVKGKEVHVVRLAEKEKHILNEQCKCDPFLDYKDPETSVSCYLHFSMDN